MKCLVTGQDLPARTPGQRGRPRAFVSTLAARWSSRLAEVEAGISSLQEDPGLTVEAAARIRGHFFRLGNLVKLPWKPPTRKTMPFGIRLPLDLIKRIDASDPGKSRSAIIQGALAEAFKG